VRVECDPDATLVGDATSVHIGGKATADAEYVNAVPGTAEVQVSFELVRTHESAVLAATAVPRSKRTSDLTVPRESYFVAFIVMLYVYPPVTDAGVNITCCAASVRFATLDVWVKFVPAILAVNTRVVELATTLNASEKYLGVARIAEASPAAILTDVGVVVAM
jgi:copper chaperone CopZ